MKIKKKFGRTLRRLTKNELVLRQQVNLIGRARREILAGRAKFEVHFQCHWPDHTPTSASHETLSGAFNQAAKQWDETNKTSGSPERGGAEAFALVGKFMVPLHPTDAAHIASSENGKRFHPDWFTIDERLTAPVPKIVWQINEQLPGWHVH